MLKPSRFNKLHKAIHLVVLTSFTIFLVINVTLITQTITEVARNTFLHSKDKNGRIEFVLEHCPRCRRRIRVSKDDTWVNFNATTCGKDAFLRGTGQRVVSFSFYGDANAEFHKKKGYFEGIRGNLDLMPVFFPNWTMRVYFDLNPSEPLMSDLCDLACKYDILDLCNVSNLPGVPMVNASGIFPMNWRFFPALDPQVDLVNSRDLDSRFSDRELSGVKEWLASNASVHVMRDHPQHGTAMLGGMWGADLRQKNSRANWIKSWDKMVKDPVTWSSRQSKGPDQVVLQRYVWSWAHRDVIQHDSYLCRNYGKSRGMRAYPVQRRREPNNFVAAVVNENHTLWTKCPKACRPKDHLDWEYC